MDFIQVIALALLQGLTEFLPISSSGHLILLPQIEGWVDQGLAFDVAVHGGTLAAVIWYFRHSLEAMTRDWIRSVVTRRAVGESGLAWAILLGTIPVGVAGLLLRNLVESEFRAPLVIAWATIGFALLLWLADAKGGGTREEGSIGWKDALLIGGSQAIALIPGTSRSGITMTVGLMLGLSRSAAARFSFLLSIPVILLACAVLIAELVSTDTEVDWMALMLGVATSGIAAYLCIGLFLRLVERIGMLPFVIYRLALGAVLLGIYL